MEQYINIGHIIIPLAAHSLDCDKLAKKNIRNIVIDNVDNKRCQNRVKQLYTVIALSFTSKGS